MNAQRWVLAAILAVGNQAASAQAPTANERFVQLAEVLGNNAVSTSANKIKAIQEIEEMRTVSAFAAGMLFDRANTRFEPDPLVREAAVLAVLSCCDPRNRMAALRVARIANADKEQDFRVRIAALKSLAGFETAEAAAAVYDAADPGKEPDPKVREAAKELIQKGLAASLY